VIVVDRHSLAGRGTGWIDVHLLAATALAGNARLWTRDKRLAAVADELGLGHVEEQALGKTSSRRS
jgi:predicted nucleic acid-binding protein